jgi:hypothetical protein
MSSRDARRFLPSFRVFRWPVAVVLLLAGALACAPATPPASAPAAASHFTLPAGSEAFLDQLEEQTFRYFWDLADPTTGLVPDRWPTKSFASVSATGFGLTAYPIGAERGWITRQQARDRVLLTLRFLANAPQGPQPTGVSGYRGFFYHFLDPATGLRFAQVELSTVDTTFLLAGALFCAGYFDQPDVGEREIRELATTLYARVEWTWAQPVPPAVSHGWHPETGWIPADWRGYNEATLLYLLALGSPTHPIDGAAWTEWTSRYQLATFHGQEYLAFAPLFGHQYSHVWVDFRDIRDAWMRQHGLDYFENSRRATLAQRAWAIANPRGWRGLGAELWGVSACDGPADTELAVNGETRRFWTYAGRGVGADLLIDDGTIAPTAVGGSVPFAPEVTITALMAMHQRYGDNLVGPYGFRDALNPSFDFAVPVHHGKVVPGVGWFDTDYLGIDQGPILAMIENHRSGLVWRVMRRNPDLATGLRRAGFTGGWLDSGSP